MIMIDAAGRPVRDAAPPDGDAENGREAPRVAAIRLLVETIRLRDPALADHGVRSAHTAAAVAEELGASAAEAERVYLAALLHDVGKLGVREAILWKPAELDPAEWSEVRAHPVYGHRLVAGMVDDEVAATVLYHHERFDGEGYPHRVRLRTLPATVRIVQVADAYDALTSERPYAPPVPSAVALAEISRCAGSQFDPEAVDALYRALDGLGPNDGVGIVVDDPPV